MSKLTIPAGYKMPLTNNELQRAIELIHADFQHNRRRWRTCSLRGS